MHSELLAIQALWEVDEVLDRRHAQLKELEQAILVIRQALDQGASEVEETEKSRAVLAEEEGRLQRRLNSYVRRRDRTRELLDTGRVPDYEAAQKQFDQCAAIVDETETELLERMEEAEELDGRIGIQRQRIESLEGDLAVALASQQAQAPILQAECADLDGRRVGRWDAVNPDTRTAYRNLRRLGWVPVTFFEGSVCESCHMTVSSQVALEVKRGKRTHTCRGCRRWLVPVEEDILETSATAG